MKKNDYENPEQKFPLSLSDEDYSLFDEDEETNQREDEGEDEYEDEEWDDYEDLDEDESRKSEKDKFINNIRENHPELEDEDEVYKYANDNYEKKRRDLEDLNKASGDIVDILSDNPDAIDFFQAISETGDVEDALQTFPLDVLERAVALKRDGDSSYDRDSKIAKHRDNMLSRREFKQKMEENEPRSIANIEAYAEKNGMEPEDVVNQMLPIVQKIQENDIDEELLDMIFYETNVKKEYDRGVIDGKNAKISNVPLKKKSSGLPQPKSNTATGTNEKKTGNPFGFMTE